MAAEILLSGRSAAEMYEPMVWNENQKTEMVFPESTGFFNLTIRALLFFTVVECRYYFCWLDTFCLNDQRQVETPEATEFGLTVRIHLTASHRRRSYMIYLIKE